MGSLVSFCAGAFLLFWPYAWCRMRGERAGDYGLFWRYEMRSFARTLAVCAIVLVPLTGVALVWPWDDLPHSRSLAEAVNLGVSGLAAAVIEETFFRGWLQPVFQKRMNPYAAIVAANLVFAPIHLIVAPNPISLCTFFPGLVMGWLKHKSGNLFPPALFHFIGNVWSIWFFPVPIKF